ncbi:MAG: hypothetical protein ACKVQS_04290 [Fimbriimonadaceae bacterium]
MGWQQRPIPASSISTAKWESEGTFEQVFTWQGVGPAPSKLGLVVTAYAVAAFNEELWPGTTSGSGTVENGYGKGASTGESGAFVCSNSIESNGKHFIEVDVIDGVAVFKSETLRASAQSSGPQAKAFAGVNVSAVPDSRAISLSMGQTFRSTVVGYEDWYINNFYVTGWEIQPYLKRAKIPSLPKPMANGRFFSQDFIYGVPVSVQAQTPFSGNIVDTPFSFGIIGNATKLGTTSDPDLFEWLDSASGVPILHIFPSKPWSMPSHLDPGTASYTANKDVFLVGVSPVTGVIEQLQFAPRTSGNILSVALKMDWNDNVNGQAEAKIILRGFVELELSFGPRREISPFYKSVTGWVPSSEGSVTINDNGIFTVIKTTGSALKVAGLLPQLKPLAAMGTILGLVGDVGSNSVTPKTINRRGDINNGSKIWPDPVITGYSWQSLHTGAIPSIPPLLSFKWMAQYQPAVDREFHVYQRFDANGFLDQVKLTEDTETPLMVGGALRDIYWHDLEPTAPPAYWYEQ